MLIKRLIKILGFIFVLLLFAYTVNAASFLVKKIQVQGLQRVPKATLLSYLPIKVGQQFNLSNTSNIINTLYKTGFFNNITLQRDAGVLIVKVQERPTISEINITGNKQIPEDKLNDALKKMGLQKGRFLDHAILQQIKQALRNQYYATGRYNVDIDISQTKQPRNRIAINIAISEGAVAKIASIQIIGNKHYSQKTLLKNLDIATPSLLTFFTKKDEYSAEKLQKAEQELQDFYMNNGYANIKINSVQVAITPSRKKVYIVFKISEGKQFTFSGFKLSGNLVGKTDELKAVAFIKQGKIFSRQKIIDTNKAIIAVLGNDGYAFANSIPEPKINNKTKTVFINYKVNPGRQYYIRKINFSGNQTTSEIALRNQFYEMEGSLFSTNKIHDSVYQLQQNTYLNQAEPPQIIPHKVSGSNDLLDLDVKIAERLSAQFQFSVGFSEVYGLLLSTGITQHNFMGTGKTVGFNINTSAYQKSFSFNYLNPYYLPDGVSRSLSLYGSAVSAQQISVAPYNTNSYGFNVSYGFPLSIHSSLNLGYGFASTLLRTTGSSPQYIKDFIKEHGDYYDQLLLTAGWSRRTTNRPIFPTTGTQQALNLTLSAPVNQYELEYYKLSYNNDWYHPLNQYFILHTHGIVGFGNGYGNMHELPFFQNYYAGGIGTQGLNRAYYPFSLGPQQGGEQLGGNLLLSGSLNLILPNLFHNQMLRTSVFLDAGNVFQTHRFPIDNKYPITRESIALKNIRYSYGVTVQWWTPLNLPLIFSLAEPINSHSGDQLDAFQFTIGTMY